MAEYAGPAGLAGRNGWRGAGGGAEAEEQDGGGGEAAAVAGLAPDDLAYDEVLRLVTAMVEQTVQDLQGVFGQAARWKALEWVMPGDLDALVDLVSVLRPLGAEAVRRGLLERGGVHEAEAARYRWRLAG